MARSQASRCRRHDSDGDQPGHDGVPRAHPQSPLEATVHRRQHRLRVGSCFGDDLTGGRQKTGLGAILEVELGHEQPCEARRSACLWSQVRGAPTRDRARSTPVPRRAARHDCTAEGLRSNTDSPSHTGSKTVRVGVRDHRRSTNLTGVGRTSRRAEGPKRVEVRDHRRSTTLTRGGERAVGPRGPSASRHPMTGEEVSGRVR